MPEPATLAPGQSHPHFCETCRTPWVCGEAHPRCARPWLSPHPGDAGRGHVWRADPLRIDCAWCSRMIREGAEPTSHGICPACAAKMREEHGLKKER